MEKGASKETFPVAWTRSQFVESQLHRPIQLGVRGSTELALGSLIRIAPAWVRSLPNAQPFMA
jgi:hypothetical protein